MEMPFEKAVRLLSSLEDLVAQEGTLLRGFEISETAQVSELAGRVAPLVLALGALEADPLVARLRPRIAALLARRQANVAILDSHLARLHAELCRCHEARGRLIRVAPVYGAGPAAPIESRFNAAA